MTDDQPVTTGTGTPAVRPRAAGLEVASLLGTVAAVLWLPFLVRPGHAPIAVLVAVALLAGASGVLVDLVAGRRLHRPSPEGATDETTEPTETAEDGTFTTIVVLGDEPDELQRHSVELAQQAGPCVVIAPAERAHIEDLGVTVITSGRHTGASGPDPLQRAIERVDTDAVLLLSGRAAPLAENCRAAAGRLDDTHPWAIGLTRPFNQDGFGSDSRGHVDALLRRRSAAVGLALWEPNATLVRTQDLRRHPIDPHRPRGAWLRARHAEGGRPATVDQPLSLVAAPAGAHTFWPESMAQQRGSAADAADAVRSGRGTARRVALGLLVRDCFAWSMLTWLLVLFTGTVSGELPMRTANGAFPALVLAALLLRWVGLYRSAGRTPHPFRDLRATVDDVPGSLAALPSAITGRVGRGPSRVAVRPLLWAGLLSVAVLVTALVDHSPDQPMTAPAVGAALLTLVLLWVVCIQVLVQRGWERTSFRVPLSRPARLDSRDARTVDVSPEGLAVELTRVGSGDTPGDPATGDGSGQATSGLPAIGSSTRVGVELDDGSSTDMDATVVWTHHGHRRDLVGLRLELDESSRPQWAGLVLHAAETAAGVQLAAEPGGTTRSPRTTHSTARTHSPRTTRSTDRTPGPAATATAGVSGRSRALDVVGLGATVLLSIVLLAVLGGAMLGLQAAVVRSGSMTPTIAQGSVVVSESVPVSSLRPGDVVTRPAEGAAEPVTHRLVSATRQGDTYLMQTRGDANESGETWTVPADSTLPKIRWVVPSIGDGVAVLRSHLVLVLGLVVIGGLLIAALRLPARRHRPTMTPASA